MTCTTHHACECIQARADERDEAVSRAERALRTLVDSTPANPLTEYDVYRTHQVPGYWLQEAWHGPLNTLVKRGLAVRCGGRPAQWYITDAGRETLLGEVHDACGTDACCGTCDPP